MRCLTLVTYPVVGHAGHRNLFRQDGSDSDEGREAIRGPPPPRMCGRSGVCTCALCTREARVCARAGQGVGTCIPLACAFCSLVHGTRCAAAPRGRAWRPGRPMMGPGTVILGLDRMTCKATRILLGHDVGPGPGLLFDRQPRAALSSEVIGHSEPFGVTCI
jgi:hypothetical protein